MGLPGRRVISKWQWYSVKLIFESFVSGGNSAEAYKMYEESIILVKAQSFNHAYKIAEKKAREAEAEAGTPDASAVHHRFLEAIDCFLILEEPLSTGAELYWRVITLPKETDTAGFISRFYPDTIPIKGGIDAESILRNREFNKRPGT